jgi:hypothetical protein
VEVVVTAELRNDQAACDLRDRALVDERRRLTAAMRSGELATSAEVAALRRVAAAAVEWRAQFHGPGRGPRETVLFAAVAALTDVDPYADVRPPDGECYCGGCVGMGPCDDDLCRSDEDDDGWFLDHDDWNDGPEDGS